MTDFTFVMGAGGVPAGAYNVEFSRVDKYAENAEQYGEGVLLVWKVLDGEHDGEETSRICSRKFSPKSALAKFATALKGEQIQPGEEFSFEKYIGVKGMVMVEPTESGSTRVASFIRQK